MSVSNTMMVQACGQKRKWSTRKHMLFWQSQLAERQKNKFSAVNYKTVLRLLVLPQHTLPAKLWDEHEEAVNTALLQITVYLVAIQCLQSCEKNPKKKQMCHCCKELLNHPLWRHPESLQISRILGTFCHTQNQVATGAHEPHFMSSW